MEFKCATVIHLCRCVSDFWVSDFVKLCSLFRAGIWASYFEFSFKYWYHLDCLAIEIDWFLLAFYSIWCGYFFPGFCSENSQFAWYCIRLLVFHSRNTSNGTLFMNNSEGESALKDHFYLYIINVASINSRLCCSLWLFSI